MEKKLYTDYYEIDSGGGRIGLSSCIRCGAAVIMNDSDVDAVKAHEEWHRGVKLSENQTPNEPL